MINRMNPSDKFMFFLGAFVFLVLAVLACIFFKAFAFIALFLIGAFIFVTCALSLLYFVMMADEVIKEDVIPGIKNFLAKKPKEEPKEEIK